ncbi:MAG: hypothetical protein ABI699_01945 [Caldimonas sp.]
MTEAVVVRPAGAASSLRQRIDALQGIVGDLVGRRPRPRPERLSGMHNPWGHSAVLANAWRFLDVCEDTSILDSVEALIGPDIVLWDSELHLEAASYLRFVEAKREGRYWPATPQRGAVALVAPEERSSPIIVDVVALSPAVVSTFDATAPLYVIRYMAAASHFDRDPRAPANWVAMEEQPLINYATRPLWLVRGADRADNDFVTGFAPSVPRWAAMQSEER